jgi:hypothetical protein
MFDHKHYVPILKGRDGEYGALNRLSPASRDGVTPLIELPPIRWDFVSQCPAGTIDTHLKKVGQKIERSWGKSRPFFLDFVWIHQAERMSDGRHPVEFVFSELRSRGVAAIPVVRLISDEAHLATCAEAAREDGRGACVRVQREDFVDFENLSEEFQRVLAATGVVSANADLLLDLQALTPEARQIDATAALALISRIPNLRRWRTFTLAATSFPQNLIGLPPSDSSVVIREEWGLWNAVLRGHPSRLPTFGDYGISHPEPSEVDPRVMRPSASVRYTADGSWIVLKARNLRDYGYEQFHDVCRDLIAMTEYSGREFSWGDEYIDDCANDRVGTGNLTTWRKVGTSHHIAFVEDQLASPFGS